MPKLTKIFVKDAKKYIELEEKKTELKEYIETIRFGIENPEGLKDITFSSETSDGFQARAVDEHIETMYLDNIKTTLLIALEKILLDRLAWIDAEQVKMLLI